MDYLNSNNKCFISKCKKEQLDAVNENNKISEKMSECIDKFIKKKISESEMNHQLKKLKNKVYNNNKKIKLLTCQLSNCYKVMEKNIFKDLKMNIKSDYSSDYVKKISQDTYDKFKKLNIITVKDYINYNRKVLTAKPK